MKKNLALLVIIISVGGCATKSYIMQNPKTKEVVQCNSTGGGSMFILIERWQNNAGVEHCAEGYEAAGWKRLNP
jgi:hypothetical protein